MATNEQQHQQQTRSLTLHVVCGRQGAGKTTVARIIAETARDSGDVAVAWEVSEPLKTAVAGIFGFSRAALLNNASEEERAYVETPHAVWEKALGIDGFSPRMAMQLVGKALRDAVSPDVWVAASANKVRSTAAALRDRSRNVHIVVSGVRYINEAAALRDLAAPEAVVDAVRIYLVDRGAEFAALTPDSAECELAVEALFAVARQWHDPPRVFVTQTANYGQFGTESLAQLRQAVALSAGFS